MDKKKLESILYAKKYNPDEEALFNFNMLTGRPIYSMLSENEIYQLYQIATDMKLSANLVEKIKKMNAVLRPKGFERFGNGTNRIVYRSVYDSSILLKVAIDKVGLGDALREMENQSKLAPFVTKIFDVHPSGIVASVERVIPIKSHKVLSLLSEDFYNLITKVFVGKFVMEDIGDEYFMNWGIREGFGLVLLDFPYLYELDGNKLICRAKNKLNPNIPCLGEIDYDIGFNHLVCKRCGMEYRAKDMAKLINERGIEMVRSNNTIPVGARIVRGNTVICESKYESNTISKEKYAVIPKERSKKTAPVIPSMREQHKEFTPPVVKTSANVEVQPHIKTPVPPNGYFVDTKAVESKQEKPVEAKKPSEIKVLYKPDSLSEIISAKEIEEIVREGCKKAKSYDTIINDILCLIKGRINLSIEKTLLIKKQLNEGIKCLYDKLYKHYAKTELTDIIENDNYESIARTKGYDNNIKINVSYEYENNSNRVDFDGTVVNENQTSNEEVKEVTPSEEPDESGIKFVSIENNKGEDDMPTLEERTTVIEKFNAEIDRTIESYLKYFQEQYPDKTYEEFKEEILELAEEDYKDYPESDILKKAGKDPIEFGKKYILEYLEKNNIKASFEDNDYLDNESHIEKIKSKKRTYSPKMDKF